MQTRRSFLYSGAINLATFAVGGSLVVAGKEQAKQAIRNYNRKETEEPNAGDQARQKHDEDLAVVSKDATDKVGLPVVTVNHATDFALGGLLGIGVKKIVTSSVRLKRLNGELSSTVKELQQLEDEDLPKVEKTLRTFITREGIHYNSNNDDSLVESIRGSLDAILTHINSHKKASQGFIDELQKLREVVAEPLVKQLSHAGESSADSAAKEALIQVLRSNKLTQYLETIVVNALENNEDAGVKIGTNIVNSLAEKDLISDEAISAIKQTLNGALTSESVSENLGNAINEAINKSSIAEDLVSALETKLNGIAIPDGDSALTALRNALRKTLESDDFSETLGKDMDSYFENNTIAEDLLAPLLERLKDRDSLPSDDPGLAALRTAFNNALESDTVSEELGKDVDSYLENNTIAEDLLAPLVEKLKSGEIKENDPSLLALKNVVQAALEGDNVNEKLWDATLNAVSESYIAENLVSALEKKLGSSQIQDTDPSLLALRTLLKDAIQSDGVSEKLSDAVSNAVGDSDLAEKFVQSLQKAISTGSK